MTMAGSFQFFDRQGRRYQGAAIAYAILGYATGIAGLFAESWIVNILATLLLSHAMIIAAYLIHECGHMKTRLILSIIIIIIINK